MNALHAAAFSLIYAYGFWMLYVLIMGFYRAHLDRRLNGLTRGLALPTVVVGYAVDLVANYTFATLWFLELPWRPLELVTDRLTRYINGPDGRAKRHAVWVCETLLDPFDPTNKHCKTKGAAP